MLAAAFAMMITVVTTIGCACVHAIRLNTRGDTLTREHHVFYMLTAFGGSMLAGIVVLSIKLLWISFSAS